ncbi:MAG: hypothetical protein EOO38_26020 [Cytophagaceae bacterium]|nr:MAG: hypothetical protein EOO38_26020 [Cytophagaceae bacterium]
MTRPLSTDAFLEADIMTALREATHAMHVELESKLCLLDPHLSLADYKATLSSMHTAYTLLTVEQAPFLSQMAATTMQWAQRQHIVHLDEDLATLGGIDKERTSHSHRFYPTFPDRFSAWGSAYVIEGASLGGQVLTRRLAKRLHLSPSHGLAFFSGYGPRTGKMWRIFRTTLRQEINSDPSPAAALASCVDGARAAFGVFLRVFSPSERPPIQKADLLT